MRKKNVLELTYGCAAILFFICCYNKQIFPTSVQAEIGKAEFERNESYNQENTSGKENDGETVKEENGSKTENGSLTESGSKEESGNRTETVRREDGSLTENVQNEESGSSAKEKTENTTDRNFDIENREEYIQNETYEQYRNNSYSWWFLRKMGHIPSKSGEQITIGDYNAIYRVKDGLEADKVIFLTFDCGYENGYTDAILDALAAVKAKALFFVTKDFIIQNPEYVKRMKTEGHLVGNHTVQHLSLPTLTAEEVAQELLLVEAAMREQTGYELDRYFRPPFGDYSERTLKVAQDLGYRTVFWSIAYHDYDEDDQPGKDYVVEHFSTYHHNGAIPLIHNTSESNAQALPEVLELLIQEGYRFGTFAE